MAYTITLTDGTVLTTIADATVDTTTSLSLVGRNVSGYGGYIAENFVYLLENFSSTSAPETPLVGQLWYNSAAQVLAMWSGSAWTNVGFPADGLVKNTNIGVQNAGFLFENTAAPSNQRIWKVSVSDQSPYIGMLVFQALNDDLSVRYTVMALDGVNNLIIGAATYS